MRPDRVAVRHDRVERESLARGYLDSRRFAAPVVGASVAPQDNSRPVGLVTTDNSISGASLALIGLGVAGVGMFVAGMAALFAGRRGRAPEAARARS